MIFIQRRHRRVLDKLQIDRFRYGDPHPAPIARDVYVQSASTEPAADLQMDIPRVGEYLELADLEAKPFDERFEISRNKFYIGKTDIYLHNTVTTGPYGCEYLVADKCDYN